MATRGAGVRLYVPGPLAEGAAVALDAGQAHYLGTVMRRRPGDEIGVFDGRCGEWAAGIEALDRRGGTAVCRQLLVPQRDPPDLWLLFAPVKRTRTDFIVEKATELGVAGIRPVMTRFTNAERVRLDRLQAHAVEAAEQCGATHVPQIAAPVPLAALLADWPGARRLLFCDETGEAPAAGAVLRGAGPGPWAVLIGPEGGFAPEERQAIRALAAAVPVTLGPRILRADTAAVAALTLWQAHCGDWRSA